MKSSDKVHALIKTMTKSEKRYFKLFIRRVTQKEEQQLEELFDALDGMREYSEDKLRQRFGKDSGSKNLLVSKDLLYGNVLRSLHSFHEESSPGAKLRSQLHFAEIMLSKGLIKHARQQLRVARDIAQKHELLTYVPSILRLELQVEDKESRGDPHQQAQIIYEQYCDALKKLSVQALYVRRQKEIQNMASNSTYSRNKNRDYADLDLYMKLPEIAEERGPSSVRSQYYFYDIQVYGAFLRGDYEKVYLYSSRLVRLAQEHSAILQHDIAAWLAILNRHSTACALLKLGPELKEAAELIRKVKTSDERFRVMIFEYAAMAEFNYCVLLKDFDTMFSILPRFETEFAEVAEQMERLFYYTLSTQAAAFYFLMENYQKAHQWVNRALSVPEIEQREDIFLSARITEIQVLFELQKYDDLNDRLKSFYRYLSKRPHLSAIEEIFIRNVRSLIEIPIKKVMADGSKALSAFFTNMRNDTIAFQQSASPEKRIFNYVDLIAWLDSKIENRPMREMLKRHATE